MGEKKIAGFTFVESTAVPVGEVWACKDLGWRAVVIGPEKVIVERRFEVQARIKDTVT